MVPLPLPPAQPPLKTGDLTDRLSGGLTSGKAFAPAQPEGDVVNKPAHYARFKIEPITFIMRNGLEFWRGNPIKYIARAGHKLYPGKNASQSEIIDLKKAIRMCEMRINQLEGETVL